MIEYSTGQLLIFIILNGRWCVAHEPFPGRGEDSREPSGSALPPAQGAVPEDDWDAEAALAAEADAGEWDLTPEWLAGDEPPPMAVFSDEGLADEMGPGPVLAALVHAAVQDPAALDEDQLVGVIAAIRRIESRMAWASMTAMRELTSRRRDARDQVDCGRTKVSATAADQVSMELRQSWQSAAAQIAYACDVAARLPKTFAALAAGLIHPIHVRIIEDETRYLSDQDAASADETLAEAAKTKSYGELRYAARRLALKLDPSSAARRKEAARRGAEVRRFREESGNAGMIARELPSAEVLASWQHIEQRALDLRAAGAQGTLQELRVKAYLDLLQERDSRPAPDAPPTAQAVQPDPDAGVAAMITLTVSLDTAVGRSAAPGDVAGFGLLDAPDTRDLIAAAARHPRTRWCLTVLHPDGTAAAHGCAPGRHPAPPGLSRFTLRTVIRGPCDHAQAEARYRPSRKLWHLIAARSTHCTAPGCSRPAARCDLDHTTPWDHGGPTCPCNLAPLCRHHHKCKQRDGWTLEQPEPGVLVWRTPAGRTYTTTPTAYPV
jgi:Domain of unknown function (DUF222)